MIEKFERPPLYDLINQTFKIAGKPVFFAWGKFIYNPTATKIPPQLLAHEEVHGARQATYPMGVLGWWVEYCRSPAFRLAEEVPAHRAEYRYLAAKSRNRQARRTNLRTVAKRLSGPLYGRMISLSKARQLIQETA